MIIFYTLILYASVVLTMIFSMRKQKHTNVYFSLLFAFVPISSMGYLLRSTSQSLETALIGNDLVYLGGCFQILFIMFSLAELCRLPINRYIKTALLFINSLVYLSIVTNHRFYTRVGIKHTSDGTSLVKEYGIMHSVFIAVLLIDYSITVGVIFYGYFVKRDCSKNITRLMAIPLTVSLICYFLDRMLPLSVELVPLSYIAAQIVYIIIMRRMSLYDINDSAIDSLSYSGHTGLISFDKKMRFLGCNQKALEIIPALSQLTIDSPVRENAEIHNTILRWVDIFREDENNDKFYYEFDDNIYLVDVNALHDGAHRRGYQIVITDDTQNQKLMKTQHLMEMLDNLVMSMAMMVESRDNSTGGHIKRTREGVRILVEEIQNDNTLNVSEKFCTDLVRAAPMHDLGKIAVDDAVLRKPGRFTPEEFEKMKQHAPEGARIVHEILKSSDDHQFHILAENVAHYHHERWDGSGYPDGLAGEKIPLEARIMAIADVYDALVSKRVYKDSMSFEQADKIIMEGMGQHFDKGLEKYYVRARPRLEKYYSSLENDEES